VAKKKEDGQQHMKKIFSIINYQENEN